VAAAHHLDRPKRHRGSIAPLPPATIHQPYLNHLMRWCDQLDGAQNEQITAIHPETGACARA
jgi:hypothetical protein